MKIRNNSFTSNQKMKQLIAGISILIAIALFSQHTLAQATVLNGEPLLQSNGTDVIQQNDTLQVDDAVTGRTILEMPVQYSAQDSITMFPRTRMAHLFGNAEIQYGDIVNVTAQYITVDMNISEIEATFGLDSLGVEIGLPVFRDRSGEYEVRAGRYNFTTGNAFFEHIVTQQGEGNVIARYARMNPDNSFFMQNARYTTCPNHENPHFYLRLSRAKVRPGQDVVTGPSVLVLAGLPLFPVGLPFAFFPFTETFSSGIIMPSYGQEMMRGFFLHNGGYYFAINDFVDLAVTGEISTRGTWGIGARSNYRVRYRFSGNFNFYYLNTAFGDRDLRHIPNDPPFFHRTRDLRVNWTHSQDPNANMFRTTSASVNFGTSGSRRNDLNMMPTREASNNTTSSTVNITQRFPDSPWNLSATMSMNQVTRDSTISLTLPNISASMNRIHPFRRRHAVGAPRWFERITMSYSGEFRNHITTRESEILSSHLIRDWTNGIRHNIPINATFTVLDFIQISPSFNYTERWYTSGVRQAWDPTLNRHVVVDTVHGFSRVWDYSASLSAQTRLYGMYVPWRIFGDHVQAIRHVFSPSISLSYRPDFADPRFNSFITYTYRDEFGDERTHTYSPYAGMMFGAPSRGRSGTVGFDFRNNIEMRVRDQREESGSRKISLIDDLGISFNYNMMADSMRWSNINTNIRIRFTQRYTLSLNMMWDPYMIELDSRDRPVRVDKLRIMHGRGFGRLMSTGTSFSYSINQDTFRRLFSRNERGNRGRNGDENGNGNGERLPDDGTIGRNPNEFEVRSPGMGTGTMNFDADGFMINPINWNISFNYNVRYGLNMQDFDEQRMEFRGRLTHNLGVNGSFQPTANWSFTFNTDYNFELRRFTHMNTSITRRMCCWSMSASVIPFGPFRSYSFTIRADASLLRDLKYDQRSSPRNRGTRWY